MYLIYKFTNNPGFGDNLRGLISILQIQKKLNFKLIIDLKGHRFEKFFLYETPIRRSKSFNINFYYCNEENHNSEIIDKLNEIFKNFEIIEIKTNNYPIENEIDEDIKNYIKNLLSIRPEIQEYLNTKFSNLPKEYNLFHYRLGDDCFENNHVNENFVHNFISNKKDNSVLISDSLSFKITIKKLFENKDDVFIFLDKPCHTNMNNDNFLDTFSDFYLVQNAQSINCCSCYSWISNFIHWSAKIYNVPIHRI